MTWFSWLSLPYSYLRDLCNTFVPIKAFSKLKYYCTVYVTTEHSRAEQCVIDVDNNHRQLIGKNGWQQPLPVTGS